MMYRSKSSRLPGAVLFLAALCAVPASADEPGKAGVANPAPAADPVGFEVDAPRRVVLIAEPDERGSAEELIEAVNAQISDIDVRLKVEWLEAFPTSLPDQVETVRNIASRNDAVAIFWCDLERADALYLHLSDADQERVLVRRLDRPEEGDPLETLAIIVRAAVDALLRGGEIDVAVEVPAEKTGSPPKKAEPPAEEGDSVPVEASSAPSPMVDDQPPGRSWRLESTVAYELSGHSSQQPVVHGLALGVALRFVQGIAVSVGYAFRGAVHADRGVGGSEVAIDISSHPITAGLSFGFPAGDLRLGAALALTWDIVTQETRAVPPGDIGLTNNDLIFSASPLLEIDYFVRPHVALFAAGGVELFFNNVRYRAEDENRDSGYVPVDEPWWVGPRFHAGLRFIL